MGIVVDTGILYSYYDRQDDWHERAVELFERHRTELIVPAAVIPEVDYLISQRLGPEVAGLFYRGLIEGNYFVAELPQDKYTRVLELNQQFADLELGFVDASVIAIAEMLEQNQIATSDRRHFNPVAAHLGFVILP